MFAMLAGQRVETLTQMAGRGRTKAFSIPWSAVSLRPSVAGWPGTST